MMMDMQDAECSKEIDGGASGRVGLFGRVGQVRLVERVGRDEGG